MKIVLRLGQIGLYRQISQQLLNQSLPTFQLERSPDLLASHTIFSPWVISTNLLRSDRSCMKSEVCFIVSDG